MNKALAFSQAVLAAVAIGLSPGAAAHHPGSHDSLAPMLEQVTPGVVNIATRSRIDTSNNPLMADPFFRHFFNLPRPRQRESQSLGSGVIVDAKRGYILTNHHVIDNASQITVTLTDGRELEASLVGSDPETDIAVIKVDSENLTEVRFGKSDELRVGDYVVAIGNPFGLGQTVTSGIISALGRSGLGIEGYEDFIQTDASINPGNSGGALVNVDGELIGVNTAIVAPGGGNVGIGFAIPARMAKALMEQIIEFGAVQRGRLGVSAQNLNEELARALKAEGVSGAVITQVESGSTADKAGLRSGDVVTAVNGREIRSADDLRNSIGLIRAGEDIRVDALRDGKPFSFKARISSQDNVAAETLSSLLGGATLAEIDAGHPLAGSGIYIKRVEPGSPAARAGLRPGDIISSVNRREIRSIDDFQKATTSARGELLLNIRRGNRAFFLMLR
ncbi:protease Do [Oceanococcus atlanticus]|uniref:Protease Do n=1 Tax=Oceanococcus atlanticus TaxID=1317117 RepID=A0A1Y1SIC9_9GAMM|nr:DegQ family serine endoprotease [Oceanococcus atlanticus]ORE89406.1 protease Do [Oceanococcus atlanticus]